MTVEQNEQKTIEETCRSRNQLLSEVNKYRQFPEHNNVSNASDELFPAVFTRTAQRTHLVAVICEAPETCLYEKPTRISVVFHNSRA